MMTTKRRIPTLFILALFLALSLPRAGVAQGAVPRAGSCGLVSALNDAAGPVSAASQGAAAALSRARRALDAVTVRRLELLTSDPVLAPVAGAIARDFARISRAVTAGDPGLLPTLDPTVAVAFGICERAGLVSGIAQGTPSADAARSAQADAPVPASTRRVQLRAVDLDAPDNRRSFFLLGFTIFGLASYVMHRRNIRSRRQSRRRMCHLKSELRLGGVTYAATVRDLSQKGAGLATCPAGPLQLRDRVWLRLGQAWISSRVQWQTKAGFGVTFDHPIRQSVIEEVLGPVPSASKSWQRTQTKPMAPAPAEVAGHVLADTPPEPQTGGVTDDRASVHSPTAMRAPLTPAFQSRRGSPEQAPAARSDPEGPTATRH